MSETIISNGQMTHRDETGGETKFTGETPNATTGQRITQARTTTGSPRSGSDITDNDIVKVNGKEGRIKDMLRVGLVTKNHDGSFTITDKSGPRPASSQAPQQQPQQAQQQAGGEDAGEALGDAAVEATITEVAEAAQPGDVLACISSYVNDGDFSDAALSRVANQMNLTPEEARDRANTIRGAFEAQARSVVEQSGFDGQEVFNWAWQHHPNMMKDAMRNHVTQRSTKGYKDIAAKYLENLDKANPEAFKNAVINNGITAKRLTNGTILLKTPQGEVEWKTAVRNGWVKVSRQ